MLKDLNPAATVREPAADKTRAFSDADAANLAGRDVSIEVVNVEIEQTVQHGLDPAMDAPQHAYDPLGGGFESHLGEVGDEASTELDSFHGKKSKKNQWDSKWIFIGSSVLALLGMVALILAFTIFKADSAKLWEQATENFNNFRYAAAMGDLELFIKNFPGDSHAPDAKVKIANCKLRISYDTKQWSTTLIRAKKVLPELKADLEAEEMGEKFADLRSELGVILPGTALGFTEIGLGTDDVETKKEQLKLAKETMVLIDNPAYVPGSEKRKPAVNLNLQTLQDNISKIQRQIKMEHDYFVAVNTMNSLTEQGDTRTAFQTFQDLTSIYPELKTREELQQAMHAISLREADLVETIDVDLANSEAPTSAITSSVILATKSGQSQVAGLGSEMLVYLVDGSLYGVRAVDGFVIWRKYVGVQTDIDPVWLQDENKSDLIVVDSRSYDLIRISATDGTERWRVNIGEPFAQPNVVPIGLLVTTHSGKVMLIEPSNGSATQAAQVPKDCSVSGVMIGDLPFIYQIAVDSNVYVISSETMTCREVFYLGHDSSSVSVPPFVMSGHIIVPVNAANYCNLNILKPFENGLKLDYAQVSLRMVGQVNTPIARYNRWGLVMSDRGDLQMLEVNKADEEQPVSVVVKQKISSKRKGSNYLKAVSGQLWICSGSGIRRFKIQKAAGQFKEETVANNLDSFVGPGFLVGETFFHIRRRNRSSLVSVSAVDSDSLKELWRTDFAAPLAGPPISDGSNTLAVSAQGDVFEIDEQTLADGFSNSPTVRGSTVVQSLVFDHVVDFGGKYVMTGPLNRRSILAVDMSQSPPSKLTDLKPPADKPSCQPIAFGDELLVANRRGQVFRINTQTGHPVGAPFQPKLAPNTETKWRIPAVVETAKRFVIGDDTGRIFLVQAEGSKSLQKLDEIEQPGDLLSPLVALDGNVFGVTRGRQR